MSNLRTPTARRVIRPGRLGPAVAVVVAVALAASGCATEAPSAVSTRSAAAGTAPAPTIGDPELVTSGLDAPWSITFLSDGTPLVSERDSDRILELDGSGEAREVGVVEGVTGSGEGGLLGLAVDEDDHLYAYSTGGGGNRIQRFDLTGEQGSLSLGEPEIVLDGIPAASYHDGGRIASGPDGMLYATAGDAGGRSDAQDPESLSGKILRMSPDGTVPGDNPFPDSLVYSLGHRNPQGIAWASDGTMFATEFGQDTWDELNIIEPGNNYGWPDVEGIAGNGDYTDPEQQWSPDDASPSGMGIIDDVLYLANLRGQVLRTVDAGDPSDFADLVAGEYGRLRDAVAAPDGSLWILTNNTDGRGTPGDGDDRIIRIPVLAEG
jgi:glucose/arabinose dehydrogenase